MRTLKGLLEEQGNQLHSHDGRTILHVKSLAVSPFLTPVGIIADIVCSMQ
jgi:hypothetical protein